MPPPPRAATLRGPAVTAAVWRRLPHLSLHPPLAPALLSASKRWAAGPPGRRAAGTGSVKADAGLLELAAGGGRVGEEHPSPAGGAGRLDVGPAIIDKDAPAPVAA